MRKNQCAPIAPFSNLPTEQMNVSAAEHKATADKNTAFKRRIPAFVLALY